jgi:hypothetical protein
MRGPEFEEISHTGGKAIFKIRTDADGRRSYAVKWTHGGPRPAALFAVYAIPQGHAVGTIKLGGIGDPWNAPPIPDCVPVFLASDSEGMFGHSCPTCSGYWRSRGGAFFCPYCGAKGEAHVFLTEAQHKYVAHYCETLENALASPDGDNSIDMDKIRSDAEKKPDFYYSEMRQQTLRKCPSCRTEDDILGRFGYCSGCGTRSDLAQFEEDIERIRQKINEGGPLDDCLRDAVSLFDAFAGRYMKQLVERTALSPQRAKRLRAMRFQDLKRVEGEFATVFDIAVCEGLTGDDADFAKRMFHRRHVHEHCGGIVDDRYIENSGDTDVRLGQALRETKEGTHRLASCLVKMARNLHTGFHSLYPANEHPRLKAPS